MIFTDYKTPDDALLAFHLVGHVQDFIQPTPHTVTPVVRERIEVVRQLGYLRSESAIAEGVIFPVLLEVWMHYTDDLKLWSRPTFGTDDLRGNPDYVVTRVALRGEIGFRAPYVVILEAKRDNFEEGWGQCLSAMVAAVRLNSRSDLPVWGIVTTGVVWQFGKLDGNRFTQDSQTFSLADLNGLCGALRYVFEQVKQYPLPTPEVTAGAA